MTDNDDRINIDEEVDELSTAKKLLAFKRTLHRINVPFTETPEGSIDLGEDFEVDLESDEFYDVFSDELKRVYFDTLFADLQGKGLIKPVGVDPESGEINYVVTDKGTQWIEDEHHNV